ncbi:hypothetical protein [Algirhabdus cladophorae]|uniref:hypothetical protein n=1 Tax=Algirhabdus cladophorae TaxID=3377108 RepID=UPI003B84ABB9
MRQIIDVFSSIATAFNAGDTTAAVGPMTLPMPIYIGSRLILADQIRKVADVLATYRSNLKEKSHERTEYRILDQQIIGSGKLKVTVEWTNLAADGTVINVINGDYYCRRTQECWDIELVEFNEPQVPELLEGVTLH